MDFYRNMLPKGQDPFFGKAIMERRFALLLVANSVACCTVAIQAKELIRGGADLLSIDHLAIVVLTFVVAIGLFYVPFYKLSGQDGEPEVEKPEKSSKPRCEPSIAEFEQKRHPAPSN